MNLPKKFNEVYAKTNGYFWLPCPICGEMFGGHESGSELLRYTDEKSGGASVCPDCVIEAAYINARHFPDYVYVSVDASHAKRERVYELLESGFTKEERENQKNVSAG